MIVFDLFKEIKFDELWKTYTNIFNYTSWDELAKKSHQKAWNTILKTIPEKSDDYIIIFYNMYERDLEENVITQTVDAGLYELKDIKEKLPECNKIIDLIPEQMSLEEINKCLKNLNPPVSYGYEFSPWQEILGYKVDENSLNSTGKLYAASLIFYEMTFCGFDQETIQEELEELNGRLNDVLEDIERKKNDEPPLHTVTWEEIKTEFNIELPEYTKEEQLKDGICNMKTWINIVKTMDRIKKD